MADVDQTVGSWGEDTLLRSSLRTPMPLLRMLTEPPYIAEVAEEPYRGGEWDMSAAVKNLGGRLSPSSRLHPAQAVQGDHEGRVRGSCNLTCHEYPRNTSLPCSRPPHFIAQQRSHTL